MKVNGSHFRTIWPDQECQYVQIVNQTQLPFSFEVIRISNLSQMVHAIKTMQVRGAPLIGVAAAYGVALALIKNANNDSLESAIHTLVNSRPTAVNLSWALQRMKNILLPLPVSHRLERAWKEAAIIADEDVLQNQAIGQHGLVLIQKYFDKNPVNILTHCNAGWLATVDYGTALSPVYAAHDAGIPVHVWVDETRPRNQGASLTAWELAQHGVPHTVITDNAGGHLMQKGDVDIVIVGADRVTASGDVCNKVGTYLKALAAHDNNIPFYAAVPSPTIDWQIDNGLESIEIEERDADEVAYIQGKADDGRLHRIRVIPTESFAINPAFDVTPSKLVTGIVTEQGVYQPNQLSNLAI